eukprot:GEZU01005261.1.p2 GENE.GEZU01005261.1~~GEZU01005261.1.p2  ORF type:complete len:100 (+),score=26.97 GEZU01005261.1:300-599(+)
MNYIAGFISSNGTEEEVLQELQSVCPKLPSWASGYCSELMAAYGPELAAFIVQEGVNELNQFCTQIGLCSSSSSSLSSSSLLLFPYPLYFLLACCRRCA